MNERISAGSVIVGVDGSTHAERAVRWAADQAHLEGRPLVVVTAGGWESIPAGVWVGTDGFPYDSREVLSSARAIAEEAAAMARTLRPALTVETLPTLGEPRQALLDLSADAHVIVIASRGRGALRSMLLGSVSAAVAKHASCPVVVCRPQPAKGGNGGVVVGADGTPESLPVIEYAFQQASLRGLPLTVLHCFWDVVAAVAGFRQASGEILDRPELEELRALVAESVAGFAEKFPDVQVSQRLEHGLVDERLSPRGHTWDLVVVGRHPVDSVHRFLAGSTATTVIERAHTIVAVVPEARATD